MVRGGDWRSEEIKVYRSVDAPSLHNDFFLNLTAKGIYGYNQTIFHFSPKMSQASKTFLAVQDSSIGDLVTHSLTQ